MIIIEQEFLFRATLKTPKLNPYLAKIGLLKVREEKAKRWQDCTTY
jgi:hypothetical protein